MTTMHTLWSEEPILYDGRQLRAHWLLARFGLVGDAMVAFRGPCRVSVDELADLADLDGPGIAGDDMVHFVWESFADLDLLLAVHRQRLLTCQAAEVLRAHAPAIPLRRDGDDLFVGDRKLSISIATATQVSTLIHFAINASTSGAPVPTASLDEFGIDPPSFARSVLAAASAEQAAIAAARAKVRPKGEWR